MTDHEAGEPRGWTAFVARLVTRRPWLVIVTSALLGLVGGWLGVTRLPLDANTDSLISRDRPWMKDYLAFLEEFGDLEYLYAVVDTKGHRAEAEHAVDALVTALRAMPDLPGVYGRIEPEEAWRLSARAADDTQLAGLADAATGLRSLATGTNWLEEANAAMDRLGAGALTSLPPDEARTLGATSLLLYDAVASVMEAARGAEPGLPLAKVRAPEYLASDTGRLLFVAILPRKDFSTLAAIEGPLGEIRAAIAEVQRGHPNVEIGLTGKPVLQADELVTSTGDTTISFAFGLGIVAVLCVVMYRDWRRPLLAVLAFAIAIGWTQGAAALLVGRLTLLSMVFMLVLIGAGLDYGIHVVSRYTELRATHSVVDSVRRTLATAAVGTITGAVTSAAVFILAIFSNFGGLRELGIIAGAGLLLCAIAMVTTLPALLVVFDSRRTPKPVLDVPVPLASVARHRGMAKAALVVAAVATLGAIALAPLALRFESNLLKLQAQDLDSVRWERRVLADSSSLSWFGAVPTDTEAETLAVIERATKEPAIGHIRSAFDIVKPTSEARSALVARLAAAAADLGPVPKDPARSWPPPQLAAAANRLRLLATLSGGRASDAERQTLRSLSERLDTAAAHPFSADDEAARARRDETFARVQSAARAILVGSTLPLRDVLPDALRARFVSPSGRLLVQLIPAGDTWELEPLKEFVAAMRRVDPRATGVPITQSESINDMTRAFLGISLLSVLAVALVTWLDFRSIGAVALCTGTLLVGIALTLGALTVLGIPLSLANFFGIPILIGLGIDSNIHLLHRAKEDEASGNAEIDFGGTRGAVVFTALTTAIGFGGQIFASHQGMRGLGWIMVVGSLVCLATSVWVLPAILHLLRVRRLGQRSSSTSLTPSGSASRNDLP